MWPLYRPVFNLLTNPYCSFMKDHPQLALHPENPCALVYLSGKLGVLLILNLSVTLAPALLLYAVALALAPELFWKWDLAWIGPAVVAQSVAMARRA